VVKKTLGILIISLAFLFVACDGNMSQLNTIDKIPEFSVLDRTIDSRIVVPAMSSDADFFYTVFAPPITKFKSAPENLVVGDTIGINLFGTELDLSTSLLDNGLIKLYGTITEENNIETGKIEILYDKVNSKFSYYSEILLQGENLPSSSDSPENHVYVIHEIPLTDIESDNSFIATFNAICYIKMPTDQLLVQMIEDGEFYSGPDTQKWVTGYAFLEYTQLAGDNSVFSDNGIPSGIEGSFFNTDGTFKAQSNVTQIRDLLRDSEEEVYNASGNTYGPFLGHRVIEENLEYSTAYYYYMVQNESDYNQSTFMNLNGNPLAIPSENSTGATITFNNDGGEYPTAKVIMNSENISKLISGFPSADWRARTRLDD